jgi:predicted nucleic acid-binding protein
MILVDSSVWIDYFKNAEQSNALTTLINLDLVYINDIILLELIPILRKRGNSEIIESLNILNKFETDIFWEGLQEMQLLNLYNGINKVGIPDLIIAQHCMENNLELWSFDNHFALMAKNINLKLFKP